eukprot:TRINITY_DN11751_c1_g1_i3.p1 TRINITY_DN11751_c1_g1~~TRINITY_DN11751_c1_g1_i3.p1  ORF type:complete len:328 (-),score=14.83 TRINITY_DN11751_c1_g1_i3:142-1071(-)
MNMNNMFAAPEFKHVFQRISEKQDKKGYHGLRKLNKFYQEQFESKIISMDVQFENLHSVAESTLANYLKKLNVSIFEDVHNLNNLCYTSPAFLPNIQDVNVHFEETDGRTATYKILTLTEHLVLKNLKLTVDNPNVTKYIVMRGQYDISIINSIFYGIDILLENNNNIEVKNSCFTRSGLKVEFGYITRLTIILEDVTFDNCLEGLNITTFRANIILKKIKSLNCRNGVCLSHVQNGSRFYLQDSELIDCEIGIICSDCVGRIENCIIRGCSDVGVELIDSTVHHNGVQLDSNELNVITYGNCVFVQDV